MAAVQYYLSPLYCSPSPPRSEHRRASQEWLQADRHNVVNIGSNYLLVPVSAFWWLGEVLRDE
jgi:hypothetical protein